MSEDVWEALESTAGLPNQAFVDARRTASPQAIGAHRKAILRFLEELPGDMAVQDVREALDEWPSR